MNASPESSSTTTLRPPRLIQSLMTGFNAVANNIHLILLPVLLDLLLWFGPHIRLRSLVWPVVQDLFRTMRQTSSADMRPMLENLQEIWQVFLDHFNLVSSLSTFPIGLPSIMAGQLPIETPLGAPPMIEVDSFLWMLFGWLGLSLAGLVLGSLYLSMLARCCAQMPERISEINPEAAHRLADNGSKNESSLPPLRPGLLIWQTFQLVGLVIVLFILILIILIPAILLSSFLALISLGLAQLALLLISFSAIWLLVPVIFAPHGIFVSGQNLIRSALTSTKVVRYSLPGVGMFLLAMVILYQGLGLLWRAAPETSWMALIGILGHAFISTGLLASSFIYYRGGLEYIQSLRKRI